MAADLSSPSSEYSWQQAVIIAQEAALYDPLKTKLFFLVPNLSALSYLTQGLRRGLFVLPHLAGLYDDPDRLVASLRKAHERNPELIMTIRIFSTGDDPVCFVKSLVLDATIRTIVIGDYLPNRKSFRAYLSDQSKFGTETLLSTQHINVLVKDVGFAAPTGELGRRLQAGAAAGGTTIMVGTGPALAPWFAAQYIGSWGVKAILGATALPLVAAGVGGYMFYGWASTKLAPSGAHSGQKSGNRPSLDDVLAVDMDNLGAMGPTNRHIMPATN